MNKIFTAIVILLLNAMPLYAQTWAPNTFTDREFVAPTQMPGQGDIYMDLCYDIKGFKIFGFPVIRDIQNYVLVNDQCNGTQEQPITADQMTTAKSINLIASDIPSIAANDRRRNLETYGVLAVLSTVLLWVILRLITSLFRIGPQAPMRKPAAERILSAMCHIAKCDGHVTAREVSVIAHAAHKLTRRNYTQTDIARFANRIDMNLSPQDFQAFGQGLRDHEKDMLIKSVLYIAIFDGYMLPKQHKFTTNLAHGLGMPDADYRRAIQNAFTDLDT